MSSATKYLTRKECVVPELEAVVYMLNHYIVISGSSSGLGQVRAQTAYTTVGIPEYVNTVIVLWRKMQANVLSETKHSRYVVKYGKIERTVEPFGEWKLGRFIQQSN